MKFTLLILCILFLRFTLSSQIIIKQTEPATVMLSSAGQINKGQFAYATGADNNIMIFDMTTGKIKSTYSFQTGYIASSVFCLTKGWLITAGFDKKIIVSDPMKSELVFELNSKSNKNTDVAIDKKGKMLVSSSQDKTVTLWRLDSQKVIKTFAQHQAAVNCVAMTPDGKWMASGGWDNTIFVNSLPDGEKSFKLEAHTGAILALAFSPDGKYLVSGSDDNSCILWDMKTMKQVISFRSNGGKILSAIFLPDNKHYCFGDAEGNVYIADAARQMMVSSKKVSTGTLESMSINEMGQLSMAGSERKVLVANVNEFVYDSCLATKIKGLNEQNKPKQANETQDQYDKRQKMFEQAKLRLVNECVREADAIRRNNEKLQDSLTVDKYSYVDLKIQKISDFNAEKQEFTIECNKVSYPVKMILTEYQGLKENLPAAKARGIKRPTEDGDEIINLMVTNPKSGKQYPAGKQVKPIEDKYLQKFLLKMSKNQ